MSLVVIESGCNATPAQAPATAPIAVSERAPTTFSNTSAPNLSPERAPMANSSEIIGSSSNKNNDEPTTSNKSSSSSSSSSSSVVHHHSAKTNENENIPQGQKLLTAVTFPPKVLNNGQRNTTANSKVKILQNVVLPPFNNYPPQKAIIQKYINQNSVTGNGAKIHVPTKLVSSPNHHYPTHKTHIKQLQTTPGPYLQKSGIKTIPPQQKPGGMRTGIKTLPPQRPAPKGPNYIGKNTPASFKAKIYPGVNKTGSNKAQKRLNPPNNRFAPGGALTQNSSSSSSSLNQALTAQILQSLAEGTSGRTYEPSQRYQHQQHHQEAIESTYSKVQHHEQPQERRTAPNDISYVCQYVLMDHNYAAILPSPAPPTTSVCPRQSQPQHNGLVVSVNPLPVPTILSGPATSFSALISASNASLVRDDDAASDISSGGERKPETEGEETETAPEAENDPEVYEGSVTRCVCDYTHDDGYMLQCDKCKVWQHVRCIFKDAEAVLPDNYFCEVCDPGLVTDKSKARLMQQNWLKADKARREQQMRDAKLLEARKTERLMSDTSSSDGEHAHNNNVVPKRRGPVSSGGGGRKKSEPISRRPTLNAPANRRQRRESARDAIRRTPVKRKERKITKRKAKSRASIDDDEESQDVWPQPPPAAVATQLPQWIEKYEEAFTNHYSPELRARISNMRLNGAHDSFNVAQADVSVHRCRIGTHPLTGMRTVVSTMHLTPNTPVIELRGKYMLSTQHRNPAHTGMLLTRQHSQKPGPFLFFYRLARDNTTSLEVCVDTRTYGNDARFLRRSCRPNAELRHCLEKGVLHLYVVAVQTVEKNVELTVKHETHDLASVGTTSISCACGGKVEDCGVNGKLGSPVTTTTTTTTTTASVVGNSTKKAAAGATAVNIATVTAANGDTTEINRKRRGRRTVSVSEPERDLMSPQPMPPEPSSPTPVAEVPQAVPTPSVSPQPKQQQQQQQQQPSPPQQLSEPSPPAPQSPVLQPPTRRSSQHSKPLPPSEPPEEPHVTPDVISATVEAVGTGTRRNNASSADSKKLSREDRKMQAIIKAIERMEKQEQRKQENQAKQALRRESEPGLRSAGGGGDDDGKPAKRRKRKGRARTISTSQSNSGKRRLRVNSTDSYVTSGDENGVLSPKSGGEMNSPVKNGSVIHHPSVDHLSVARGDSDMSSPSRSAVRVLLSLANGGDTPQNDANKSPSSRESDSNSSPETPLSSACLLVAAAVEPLEPGFKFPKTKKAIMNEWLNKSPADSVQSQHDSSSSLSVYQTDCYNKNNLGLGTLVQAASFCDSPPQVTGSAKKRWLRQAISEECDSPNSRPETPPASDMVAPPKKRRLPRESLSSEQSFTPPTTPTPNVTTPPVSGGINIATEQTPSNIPTITILAKELLDPQQQQQQQQSAALDSGSESQDCKASPAKKGHVEIVYCSVAEAEDEQSPGQILESDAVLKERAAEMQMEFGGMSSNILDPRRGRYNNSDLVGTLEETLRFYEEKLGTVNKKDFKLNALLSTAMSSEQHQQQKKKESSPTITPAAAKRKLSISEYRQRKTLKSNEKSARSGATKEDCNMNSESNSPLPARRRSNSASSSTSSLSSDEDDMMVLMTQCSGYSSSGDSVLLATQPDKVVGFNSAPTELELQRENVRLRLKQALGLMDEKSSSPALKSTLQTRPLLSPLTAYASAPTLPSSPPPPPLTPPPPPPPPVPSSPVNSSLSDAKTENKVHVASATEKTVRLLNKSESKSEPKPEMFYSPDREDDEESVEKEQCDDNNELESVKNENDGSARFPAVAYVPPFNNPLYPNSNLLTGFVGSVIDNEPYEGRNPSPPPAVSKL